MAVQILTRCKVGARRFEGAIVTDADRFKMLFGPYKTPVFRYGDDALCALYGDVILCGLTPAFPGPSARSGRRARVPVPSSCTAFSPRPCAGSPRQAVAHWWGITPQTVSRWRKALGVGPVTEGTHRLRHDYFEDPWALQARAKGQAKGNDPARCAKIAAARRGKRRPAHIGEAVAAAHRGKSHSAETQSKMSEAHRLRGTRPPKAGRPWTDREDKLVRTLPAKEVARRTGRTLAAVWCRRQVLGMSDGRTWAARGKG